MPSTVLPSRKVTAPVGLAAVKLAEAGATTATKAIVWR